MHLLAGALGRIEDGDAAVDLGQPPGDIVILSSADSELAGLARAAARRRQAPSVRLANLMALSHPMSVDLYLDKTARHARLVVVRVLGGAGYWTYGLERLRALARGGGPALAVVPGEDGWDVGLEEFSTVDMEDCRRLWRYLVEGGAENCRRALAFADHLVGRGPAPAPPVALAHAGYYWPGDGEVGLGHIRARLTPGTPVAAIVFYRALVHGASTAPIDALVEALAGEGIAALPIFVTSPKDRECAALIGHAFAEVPPAIVLNTTAFALSPIGVAHAATVLDRPGRPVLQVVLAGSSEEAWRSSTSGLSPRDLTMNVVLPEVDGRIITRAVSFKAELPLDPAGQSRGTTYRPLADRVAFVARQAAAWVRLAAKPASARRVAIILSNYPDRDGRIANGVGLDTPASAVGLAAAMAAAGYDVAGFPTTGAELMALLLAGQTNARGVKSSVDDPRTPSPLILAQAGIQDPGFANNSGSPFSRGRAGEGPSTMTLPLADYRAFFDALPESVRAALAARWGEPEDDPFLVDGVFRLAIHRFGNVVVAVQPARGYGVDPKATYHDPDLVPPHHYLAFHAWLRHSFDADAFVHLGKHGNLEWLPGKALGLSATCWPEVALGATPLIYPFIVNDPGEGAQAKRRASAVIVDHLTPPMTRAEIHGALAELETLIDEYSLAAGADQRRRAYLRTEIIAAAERHRLDRDLGLTRADGDGLLRALDAHLCELKEMQIRDGLHVLGRAPEGRQRIDTLLAIARVARGDRPADGSLNRAIADDLRLGFDPLDCDLAAEWTGPCPQALTEVSAAPWRTAGDTVERIEALAARLVDEAVALRNERFLNLPLEGRSKFAKRSEGELREGVSPPSVQTPSRKRLAEARRFRPPLKGEVQETVNLPQTAAVLDWIVGDLAPALDGSGRAEIAAVVAALDGRFVTPGPSGAPTRGRPDVLPTGRNFYSVDVRAVPTAAAWALGQAGAQALALRYFQDAGTWPRAIAMSAWGTSNMRTGGDDIAQVLALIGAEPVWEPATGRVTGFRVVALKNLGRPRIDVTLRISGMFRDAFPSQIDLIDSAVRAIAALDEDADANPIAAATRAARARLTATGIDDKTAATLAAARVFGAKPGAYGAGLQTLVDEGVWETRRDFAEAFLAWGGFAYGGGQHGTSARQHLSERLAATDAVFHAQDNREHDILDSDDYYQFHGGLAATVETLKGEAPRLYHGDHSRPEKPVVRALAEEIARVVRGRAANPKWIAGVMRHGYKGAFEMAATVDYLFAFAATTDAVADHHFDQLFDAYIDDQAVRDFIAEANPPALAEMAARLREAIDRRLWSPRSNSAYDRLSELVASSSHGTPVAGSPSPSVRPRQSGDPGFLVISGFPLARE